MPVHKHPAERLTLILGASGDLGSAVALRLLEDGYRKFILHGCRHYQRLESLARAIRSAGGECRTLLCDFREDETTIRNLEAVLRGASTVDVLLNFQGLSHSKLIQDVSREDWQELVSVNLQSAFQAVQLVSRGMLRQHFGVILNCASVWGLRGASMETAYATLKAGILGLTRSLARELGPSGIRVNALAPGWILSRMNDVYSDEEAETFVEQVPLGRLGTPDDVAEAAAFLLSDRAAYITGQILAVDGGYTS